MQRLKLALPFLLAATVVSAHATPLSDFVPDYVGVEAGNSYRYGVADQLPESEAFDKVGGSSRLSVGWQLPSDATWAIEAAYNYVGSSTWEAAGKDGKQHGHMLGAYALKTVELLPKWSAAAGAGLAYSLAQSNNSWKLANPGSDGRRFTPGVVASIGYQAAEQAHIVLRVQTHVKAFSAEGNTAQWTLGLRHRF